MSVLIEGMEMPKEGYIDVRIFCDGTASFAIAKNPYFKEVEAIPVPEPHGRLGDLDALEELVIKQKYACAGASAHGAITEIHKSWGLHDAELMIEAVPTIIPASEEGE